jgi:hypothetical protein
MARVSFGRQALTVSVMISDEFDRRTLANMEVALERMCQRFPDRLASHEARKKIAAAILKSAVAGRSNLGELTVAAKAAATELGLTGSRLAAAGADPVRPETAKLVTMTAADDGEPARPAGRLLG